MTTASPSLTMTPLTWAMLVALALLWGCTFFFNSIALVDIPPLTLIALRVAIAAIVMWPLLLARGLRIRRDRWTLSGLLVLGALNNALPFALIAWGQLHIASGLAAVLIAMTPLFTVIVAHVMTSDERMTPARLFGVAAGLAGVVILIGPATLLALGADLLAQLAILGAAISYAYSGVYARRFISRSTPLLAIATGQITVAALILVPLALVFDRSWTLEPPGLIAWSGVAGLALSSTVIAYMLYFRILATAGATNLLLVNFLVPVSAILLGVVVLGETLEAKHFAGMALIALGLASIDGGLWRRLRPRH